jgi:hypothetical protein
MPKRNTPLTNNNQAYWVQKPDGRHYKVWSQTVLKARIERGEITEDHQVKIQRIYT